MKLAAMQPHFFPWCGYFGLLDFVDEFVILDDIQFSKRSWQQRNKINLSNEPFLLTVPVLSKNKFNQIIKDVEIDNLSNYKNKQKKILSDAYSSRPFFEKYFIEISKIYDKEHKLLIDLNLDILNFFIKVLKINTKLIFKSKLNIYSKKENMIKDICELRGCSEYISPMASKEYLNLLKIENLKFKIYYYEFKSTPYLVNKGTFLPQLSCIDLIFLKGEESINYIRENFRVKQY
jgi:hypothetical protein